MAYSANGLVTVGNLRQLANQTRTEINAISEANGNNIKFVKTENNSIEFFRNPDGTGEPSFSINFPAELFLDNINTKFVGNFIYSEAEYPGANLSEEEASALSGQPVLVLAVKNASTNTYSYSFIDLTSLVDTYTVNTDGGDTVSSKVLTINGYKIKFKISPTAGNILTADTNGLYVGHDDIKANKVAFPVGENIEGRVPQLTADGDIALSDVNVNDLKIATAPEVDEMLSEFFH